MANTAQQPPAQAKPPKPEMWWIILAKSKTLRFFAVSCEFILFLGGLWITFTTTNPASKSWLNGNINMVFLTIIGWAVDAAMPEAWLHVVIQQVEKKAGQLSWSKFVAIGISVLFLGNILYSIMTTGDTSDKASGIPSDAAGWVLLVLIVLRISVGFVYITVRQCQEWIDRSGNQQQNAPAAPSVDVQDLITRAITDLATKQDARLNEMATLQQQMQTTIHEIKNDAPTIDQEALIEAVAARLASQFEARFEALNEAMRQQVTISEAVEAHQIEAPKKPREAKKPASPASESATKVLTLRQASTTITEVKSEVYKLMDSGLSSYQIAPIVGKSPATIQRWMKDRPTDQDIPSEDEESPNTEAEGVHEAEHEANEPAM